MAIENYTQAPLGKPQEKLEEDLGDTYVLTEFDDGSSEFDFDAEEVYGDEPDTDSDGLEHDANLAEHLDDDVLRDIGAQVVEQYESDLSTRSEWLDNVKNGLKLLGVRIEETDDPFPGACAAHHPLILESAVKFQAKASTTLFDSKGPVKPVVVGDVTEEKEKQADRIARHMNYQIMEEMRENFDETEQMLFYLPIIGSAFKKVYFSAPMNRPVAEYVPVDDLIVNNQASNLYSAPAVTHVIHRTAKDLAKDTYLGVYRECDLLTPSQDEQGELDLVINEEMGYEEADGYKVHKILEQYVDLELSKPFNERDGISLPYIVSVDFDTGQVLSLRRNWDEFDENPIPEKKLPFVHYKFVPGMGFYGLGLVHLLGNLQITLTAALRSLIDAGTFANLNAGFVDKRLRIRGNNGPLQPGEFREAEAHGIDLDKAIKMVPFKEPSVTLLNMFTKVEDRSQRFADSTEQVVADSTNYGPVGTTMALLEASTKFFSGVHKRLHNAQKEEFKILADLNFQHLDDEAEYEVPGGSFTIFREDYDGRVDVVPASDPNNASQAQRMSRAQAVMANAQVNPAIHNMREVSRELYGSLGMDEEKIKKLLPEEEEAQPLDPLGDIMAAQQGKPIKAFEGQNHDAHIMFKSSFLQDPSSGGSPFFNVIAPIIQANIQEHLLMKLKTTVGGATQGQEVNEMVMAQAAQQIAQNNARLQELEQKGVDQARNKMADAEVLNAQTRNAEIQAKVSSNAFQDQMKLMRHQLEEEKERNRIMIAAMQEETKMMVAQLKEQGDMMKRLIDEVNKDEKPQTSERPTLTLNGPVDKI